MRYFPNGYRTQYSPRTPTGEDYIGSRREALEAELAHEDDPRHAERMRWRRDHADVVAYLRAGKERGFNAAAAMLDRIETYGSLRASSLAKVHGWMQASEARRAAAQAERQASAPVVAGGIKAALDTAAANGLKRPKLRLDGFVFSLAPATGRNAGAVYVTREGVADAYLGKIVEGRFIASRECPAALAPAIVQAASAPAEAAIAAGRALGVCACCGRDLSDPESIARGIGPVCAERFGFAS